MVECQPAREQSERSGNGKAGTKNSDRPSRAACTKQIQLYACISSEPWCPVVPAMVAASRCRCRSLWRLTRPPARLLGCCSAARLRLLACGCSPAAARLLEKACRLPLAGVCSPGSHIMAWLPAAADGVTSLWRLTDEARDPLWRHWRCNQSLAAAGCTASGSGWPVASDRNGQIQAWSISIACSISAM